MFEIAEAEAAILFGDGDAVQAELAHLGPKLAREFVGGVDLGGHRRDAIGGVAARGVADGVGGFAELEIELMEDMRLMGAQRLPTPLLRIADRDRV